MKNEEQPKGQPIKVAAFQRFVFFAGFASFQKFNFSGAETM
jgi:hypothetical protein